MPGTRGPLAPAVGVTARAPAKVNLVLKVGERRPDGYHDLATVFHAVGLDEQVTVADGPPGVRVTVEGEGAGRVPTGPDNLAVRAVVALAQEVGVDLASRGVDVAIAKAVPVAAGLAGGSADAAATLVALDALWGTGLDRERLRDVAAGLGSDVPFGLTGGTAVGTGRGELLAPVLGRGAYSWVLAFAEGGLSTPRVYAELDRMRGAAPRTGRRTAAHLRPVPVPVPDVSRPALHPVGRDERTGAGRPGTGRMRTDAGAVGVPPAVLGALRTGDPVTLGAALDNDLQAAAIALLPALRGCLDVGMERGALGAVVSGSGPTCAFLTRDPEHSVDLAVALTATGVCRAVVRVPGPVPGASLVG